MVGLAFWNNGFRVMSANRPIHVPADMKGLKMRINSSKVNAAIMKSVGAVPQTMAFSEVYQALQTGVIDGTEGPAVQPLHAEAVRGAEARDADLSHDQQLRRGREQDVLGQAAAGHPDDARRRDEGRHRAQRPESRSRTSRRRSPRIKASGKSEIYTPTPGGKGRCG